MSDYFRVEDTVHSNVAFALHRSRFGACVWSPKGVPVFAFHESAGAALAEFSPNRATGRAQRRLFLFSVELELTSIPVVELKDYSPSRMQEVGRRLVNESRFAVLVGSRLGLPENTLLLNPMHSAFKGLVFHCKGKIGPWYAKQSKKAQSL